MNERIVVGSDGSPFSAAAIAWASAEATRRGIELCVVGPCAEDTAAAVLIDEATRASLLVVGVAGSGSRDVFGGKPLGEIAQRVIRVSPCPVVVVPPGPARNGFRRIVLGVDGSPAGLSALEWAVAEAELRDSELLVVHAWWHSRGDGRMGSLTGRQLARAAADRIADEAVDAARSRGARSVRPLVAEDGPARALLSAAEQADLVVVGSRGRTSTRSLLEWSVSRSVIVGSPCPVVACRPAPAAEYAVHGTTRPTVSAV
jgi:nucleotide-binding universal stress UspA family protein